MLRRVTLTLTLSACRPAPEAREVMMVENAVAFLCGQYEMVKDVTALLGQRGLPADRVFLNF